MTFARSIDPILQLHVARTRVALTNADDTKRGKALVEAADDPEGDGPDEASSGTFAPTDRVPYGLYKAHGFVSPSFAKDTGFSEEDLDLLWQALLRMFDDDRSASRGFMATRALIVFRHDSPLGNAPAQDLFDLVDVERKEDVTAARSYSHYNVTVNEAGLPAGVTIERPKARYGEV
jgi:CRISPR-associated protein Csd2